MVRPGAIPSQTLGAWAALRRMKRRTMRDPQGRKRQPTTRMRYSDVLLPRSAHSRPTLRAVDSDTVFLPGRDRYQTARHSSRQNRWTISRPCPGMLMDSSRSAPTSFSSRNDLFRDRRIASRMPVLWGRVSDAHFRTYGCASRDQSMCRLAPGGQPNRSRDFAQNAYGQENRRRRRFAKRATAIQQRVTAWKVRRDLALSTSI